MTKGKARYRPTIGRRPIAGLSVYKQLLARKEEIHRDIKKKMKANGTIADKVPFVWEWRYGDKFGTVNSFTRSEARGEIKRALGIPKKKRLPIETQLRKVEFNEPSA